MSIANTSITQRKSDRPYVKQTIEEQQNSNKKQRLKEYRPSATSESTIAQKYFLICRLCFWCASYYTYNIFNGSLKSDISNLSALQHCPGCGTKGTIESLSILHNKHYRYDKQR